MFACVGSKHPKTHKLSPVAGDAITLGSIGGLGSLVYTLCSRILTKYCTCTSILMLVQCTRECVWSSRTAQYSGTLDREFEP